MNIFIRKQYLKHFIYLTVHIGERRIQQSDKPNILLQFSKSGFWMFSIVHWDKHVLIKPQQQQQWRQQQQWSAALSVLGLMQTCCKATEKAQWWKWWFLDPCLILLHSNTYGTLKIYGKLHSHERQLCPTTELGNERQGRMKPDTQQGGAWLVKTLSEALKLWMDYERMAPRHRHVNSSHPLYYRWAKWPGWKIKKMSLWSCLFEAMLHLKVFTFRPVCSSLVVLHPYIVYVELISFCSCLCGHFCIIY